MSRTRTGWLVQGDAVNMSRVATVVCVPLTSNLRWAEAPGNVLLTARVTGVAKESVANVSQIIALDKAVLAERVGKLFRAKTELVLSGIDVIFGREGASWVACLDPSNLALRPTGAGHVESAGG